MWRGGCWDHFNLNGWVLGLSIFVTELSAANIEQHPHFVPVYNPLLKWVEEPVKTLICIVVVPIDGVLVVLCGYALRPVHKTRWWGKSNAMQLILKSNQPNLLEFRIDSEFISPTQSDGTTYKYNHILFPNWSNLLLLIITVVNCDYSPILFPKTFWRGGVLTTLSFHCSLYPSFSYLMKFM